MRACSSIALIALVTATGCGGGGGGDGGGDAPLTIDPASAHLLPGRKQQFSLKRGGVTVPDAVWTATGGTLVHGLISSGQVMSALYTAPAAGSYTVRAALPGDTAKHAEALVTVTGTALPGEILQDAALTLAGSPYATPAVGTTLRDATLTLEPGVELHGSLTLMGTYARLVALGTPAQPITFVDSSVWMPQYIGTLDPSSPPVTETVDAPRVQLSYCQFTGGGIAGYGYTNIDHSTLELEPGGEGLFIGPGTVSDSHITFRGGGYLRAQTGSLERNVFTFDAPETNAYLRLAMARWNRIVNNVFRSSSPSPQDALFLVTNPESVQVLKGNSFLLWDGAILVDGTLGPTEPVHMDWSGNYWGTIDLAAIRRVIGQDAVTDPALMITLGVEPFLTAPDPATPAP